MGLTQAQADQLKADIGALVDSYIDGTPPPPPLNPVITLFEYDANGNLNWTSENGVSATLDDGTGPQSVPLNGSLAVLPPQTTTYTIRVVGQPGTTDAVEQVTVTVTPVPTGDTLGPGVILAEEWHNHADKTLTILPGTTLVRRDVPPANPEHADGGFINHGTLIAISNPGQAPIIFTSENPIGHRGHLMSHGVMQLRGVEIRDMGRTTNALISATNPLARYACHWHLAGDQPNSFIEDCVVHDTVAARSPYRFGIVIHGTNSVTCRNNVVRNKAGSGIYLEDGDELDNLIEGNLVEDIWDRNLNDWQPFPPRPDTVEGGMSGNGIYTKNPWNRIRGNTVRRAPYGYMFYPRKSSPVGSVPMHVLEFADNVAEFCHKGLEYWEVGGVDQDSVFARFTARDCKMGVYPYPAWRIVLDSPTFERCVTGYESTDYEQRGGAVLRNVTALDCTLGIGASQLVTGGEFLIDGGFMRCVTNIEVRQMTTSGLTTFIKPRLSWIRGVVHEAMPGKPLRAIVASVMSGWDFRKLNLLIEDKIVVEDHNSMAGDNFRVYWNPQQQPDFVLPASDLPRFQGSPGPEPMTNVAALAQYGKCFHGEIVPADATTRAGVVGLVK
jgi:parallel beta-helix repeat protein